MSNILYPLLANRLFLDLRQSNSPETQSAVSGIIFASVGAKEDGDEGDGKESEYPTSRGSLPGLEYDLESSPS